MSLSRQLIDYLAPGHFVSGEDMAAALGVSRAAVNQSVARLRALGLVIHGVRGKGYRLAHPLEPLDADEIRRDLAAPASAAMRVVEVFERVGSTNQQLREALQSGRRFDACFAEYQNEGRGRRGRSWLAAPYGSILMSIAHPLPGGPGTSSGLSLAAGVAVAQALEQIGCRGVGLKWPNDLMMSEAKIGGILVEIAGELGERCTSIIGVGINVDLPATLQDKCQQPTTSVVEHAGPISRNRLASLLISQLVEVLETFNHSGFGALRQQWENRHVHRGRRVRVALGDRVLEGRVIGTAEDGALFLEDDAGGLRKITTGEVMA
jgi:BirA family transcriptional regulator, biotin operon repressor / biotin---[acetyl-CoA-carboxylase] ligase